MPYDLGDVVRLSVETSDEAGTPADAGAVLLTIKKPDGTLETPAFTNPGVGIYRCDYTPATPGPYAVKWVATGANASSYKDAFDVREDFPPMLFSLKDARDMLPKASTTDNDKIRELIESTTSVIEGIVGPVVRRSVSEVFTASGYQSYFTVSEYPVISIQSILPIGNQGDTWNVVDFDVDMETGIIRNLSGRLIGGTYRVTYTVGRTVVPSAIRDAARLVLKYLWGTQLGPSQLKTSTQSVPGLPPESRLGRELPQAVIELLRDYARTGAFA